MNSFATFFKGRKTLKKKRRQVIPTTALIGFKRSIPVNGWQPAAGAVLTCGESPRFVCVFSVAG
jgi:hypothetical protein